MATITFSAKGVPNAFRDRSRLREWLAVVARDHGHRIGELNFILLGDEALLNYNRRYLQHDDYTDVITFDGQTGTGVSGDVLMSLDRIRENARSFKVPLQLEIRRVMVHALLHLLGHTDSSPTRKTAMRDLEDKYLALGPNGYSPTPGKDGRP